jgi:uncharacterized membrane-anchored protein YjiN (DUF445 family)
MKKIIDLPDDDHVRRFINEAIDNQIIELLTPEYVFDTLRCALQGERNKEATKKLLSQVEREIQKNLIPKDERKTDRDIERWLELISKRFKAILAAAMRKELQAARATGRILNVGDGIYRIRPSNKLKFSCRTPRKKGVK